MTKVTWLSLPLKFRNRLQNGHPKFGLISVWINPAMVAWRYSICFAFSWKRVTSALVDRIPLRMVCRSSELKRVHSPPTRQSHISYALKPVPSLQLPIRSSQYKAMENITTAADPNTGSNPGGERILKKKSGFKTPFKNPTIQTIHTFTIWILDTSSTRIHTASCWRFNFFLFTSWECSR